MSELKGACIIGQSGGPTSVINASAYGVIRTALDSDCITAVYGAEHGIKGVLADRLFDHIDIAANSHAFLIRSDLYLQSAHLLLSGQLMPIPWCWAYRSFWIPDRK